MPLKREKSAHKEGARTEGDGLFRRQGLVGALGLFLSLLVLVVGELEHVEHKLGMGKDILLGDVTRLEQGLHLWGQALLHQNPHF